MNRHKNSSANNTQKINKSDNINKLIFGRVFDIMNKTDTARKIQGDNGDREENDFYPTPERATEELLKRININGVTWECACGDGAISKLLPGEIISTDLIDRGYGEPYVDFLKTIKKVDWIITNPPYRYATEFAKHAIKCADNVALLCKIQFLEGVKRHKFFKEYPPKKVYVFSSRLKIYKNGIKTNNSTMLCFAWFIWERDYNDKPTIEWIP